MVSPSTTTSSTDVAASTSALVRRRAAACSCSSLPERSHRCPKTDDPDQVLEAAASCPFLGATDDERLEAQAPTDHEGSDAGRAPQLVSAERDEVGAERIELNGDVTNRCGSVEVHGHARRSTALHDLGHRLQCPDLVVAPLAIHQRRPIGGIGAEQGLGMVEVDAARWGHFEP